MYSVNKGVKFTEMQTGIKLQLTLTDVLLRRPFAGGTIHTRILKSNATEMALRGAPVIAALSVTGCYPGW